MKAKNKKLVLTDPQLPRNAGRDRDRHALPLGEMLHHFGVLPRVAVWQLADALTKASPAGTWITSPGAPSTCPCASAD